MPLLDWSEILGDDVDVEYSSLRVGHEPSSIDGDIAMLFLPSGNGIDVAWSQEDERFYVTLFQGEFDNALRSEACADFREVVEAVRTLYEIDRRFQAAGDRA